MRIYEAKKNISDYEKFIKPDMLNCLSNSEQEECKQEAKNIVDGSVQDYKVNKNSQEIKREIANAQYWLEILREQTPSGEALKSIISKYLIWKNIEEYSDAVKEDLKIKKAEDEEQQRLASDYHALSEEEKVEAKQWFLENTKSIMLKIPHCDSSNEFSEVGNEAKEHKLEDVFQRKENNAMAKYENLDYGVNYVYRDISPYTGSGKTSPYTHYRWQARLQGNIKFKAPIDSAPDSVKLLYNRAVLNSLADNNKADFKESNKSINSVYFINLIVKMFDNNLKFFETKPVDEELLDEQKVYSRSSLLYQLRRELIKYMLKEGFMMNEIKQYSRVDIYQDNPEYIDIEVGAEISYNGLLKLAEKLDRVVSKFDQDAYFEPEQPGILSCRIWLDDKEFKENYLHW